MNGILMKMLATKGTGKSAIDASYLLESDKRLRKKMYTN